MNKCPGCRHSTFLSLRLRSAGLRESRLYIDKLGNSATDHPSAVRPQNRYMKSPRLCPSLTWGLLGYLEAECGLSVTSQRSVYHWRDRLHGHGGGGQYQAAPPSRGEHAFLSPQRPGLRFHEEIG